jgi:hypothetical protein
MLSNPDADVTRTLSASIICPQTYCDARRPRSANSRPVYGVAHGFSCTRISPFACAALWTFTYIWPVL